MIVRAIASIVVFSLLTLSSIAKADEPIVLKDSHAKWQLDTLSAPFFGSKDEFVDLNQFFNNAAEVERWVDSFPENSQYDFHTTVFAHWFSVENQSSEDDWMFRVGITNVEEALIYVFDPVTGERLSLHQTGSHHILTDGIPDLNHGSPLFIPKGESRRILVTVQNSFFSGPPLVELSTVDQYHRTVMVNSLVIFLAFGVTLGLCFTGLIQCVFLREAKYFWYSVFLLSYLAGMGIYHNVFNYYFGLSYSSVSYIYCFYFAMLMFAQFISSFLDLPKNYPRLSRVVNGLKLGIGLSIIIGLVQSPVVLGTWFAVLSALSMLALYILCIYVVAREGSSARFLVLGITVNLAAYILGFLRVSNTYTLWSEVQIIAVAAIALDAVIFSIALADKVRLLKKSEEDSKKMSKTDDLTGFLNRRGFMEELERTLAEGNSVSITYIDLDNLKYVNDELGHKDGDRYILEVAGRLAYRFHDSLCNARLGGDEFVILLPVPTVGLERRLKSLNDKLVNNWGEKLGISFGTAVCNSLDEITSSLHSADMAMYKNKMDRKISRQKGEVLSGASANDSADWQAQRFN